MGFVWQAARKDLKRHATDPLALLLWMGIPLLIGALITLAFGGDGVKPKAKLLIVDEDGSLVSDLFANLLGRDEIEVLETERVARADADKRIAEGDASALLIIPAGFGDALLRDDPSVLTMRTNPAQTILPGIAVEIVNTVVELVFYGQRVLGDEIRRLLGDLDAMEGGPDDDTVGQISVAVNGAVTKARKYLFPPVLKLDRVVDTPEDDR